MGLFVFWIFEGSGGCQSWWQEWDGSTVLGEGEMRVREGKRTVQLGARTCRTHLVISQTLAPCTNAWFGWAVGSSCHFLHPLIDCSKIICTVQVNKGFFDTAGEQVGRQHSANGKSWRNLSWAGMEQEGAKKKGCMLKCVHRGIRCFFPPSFGKVKGVEMKLQMRNRLSCLS